MRNDRHTAMNVLYRGVALLMMITSLPSCSAVGLVGGAVLNNGMPANYRDADTARLATLGQGTEVMLTLVDSSRVQGRLLMLHEVVDSSYASRYTTWRAGLADPAAVPPLDATLSVSTSQSTYAPVRLRACLTDAIRLESRSGKPIAVPWGRILEIRTTRGPAFSPDILKRAAQEVPVVLTGTVDLRTGSGDVSVPLSRVTRVEVLKPRHLALGGFLIGAVVDMTIFAVMMSNMVLLGP